MPSNIITDRKAGGQNNFGPKLKGSKHWSTIQIKAYRFLQGCMFPRIRKIFSYECGLRVECGECSVEKVCGQHIVCLSVIRLEEPGEGGMVAGWGARQAVSRCPGCGRLCGGGLWWRRGCEAVLGSAAPSCSETRPSVPSIPPPSSQALRPRHYLVVPQKVASELHPKVRNHGEGPY